MPSAVVSADGRWTARLGVELSGEHPSQVEALHGRANHEVMQAGKCLLTVCSGQLRHSRGGRISQRTLEQDNSIFHNAHLSTSHLPGPLATAWTALQQYCAMLSPPRPSSPWHFRQASHCPLVPCMSSRPTRTSHWLAYLCPAAVLVGFPFPVRFTPL